LLTSKAYEQFSDEELIARYRQSNDNQWLGILLQRYPLLLLGVAMKYLKDKVAAEDAVQQIFLKALTHFPQGEILNFKGWLYVLMRNHCLQVLRNRNFNISEDSLQHLATSFEDLEEAVWKDLSLEQVELALTELKNEQQLSIRLFYLEEKTYQQIMEATGFSFMQVKSFIQNGKRNLKLIVEKRLNQIRK
jgi:RNA polymerase sigma-70 factor (ECF subfamily)